MKKRDLILINMSNYSEWANGISNRNFHIFKELEKSPEIDKIICVDFPPLTWRRAVRNYFDLPPLVLGKPVRDYRENTSILAHGKVIKRDLLGRVTKLSDRLYTYSSAEFFFNPNLYCRRLKKQLEALGFNEYVVWSFFPPIMPYVQTLAPRLTVFDAVDNWSQHSSYVPFKKKLESAYEYVKKNTLVIFTVSEDLQKIFDNQDNVYWIPNGVDLKHYQTSRRLINRDIADLPRPIIGYIGVIQKRVDLPLVKYLAEKNPDKSFVLCGPIWYTEDFHELQLLPNVHILGYKEYDESPQYIQQFDVALIPHKQDDFITSTNPMKMYEYLACGKPVVATAHSGAEMFPEEIYIADTYEDFNDKLQLALKDVGDEEKSTAKKELMENYSWSKTVKRMLELVDKKID
jgi:glycosyltransferase involved in cell wall biosynthesis